MLVRKTLAGVLATSVAGAALALTAGPASAAYAPSPDDSKTSSITATDLVGVGSDTSQHALKLLADAWNQGARSHFGQTFDVASFSALGGGTLPAPLLRDSDSAEITRPASSGAGRATLYGSGRVSTVDFARSSGAPSDADFTAGMRAIPFALDTVVVAVSSSNPVAASHPTLTLDQLRSIYVTCSVTNWNQVDATYPSSPIEPFVPKQGSGTEAFFKKSVLPTGTTNYGSCVKDHTDDADPVGSAVQEHDPAIFTAKPNALVPFSKGRAALAGNVTAVGGDTVQFKRNLYNIVRTEESNRPDIQSFFGESGFVCSAEAHDLIASAGFEQLATAALGGDCGKVLNAASSNFTVNTVTTPTVALSGTGTPSAYHLSATVTSSPAAVGTVTFSEGPTVLARDVAIVSGRAVTTAMALPAGAHSITATFNPGQSNFKTASSTSTVQVVAPVAPTLAESFPGIVHLKGATKVAPRGVVAVRGGSVATGKVSVKKGTRVLRTAALRAGRATVTLPKLAKGIYRLTIVYTGDATHLAASKRFTIKIVK